MSALTRIWTSLSLPTCRVCQAAAVNTFQYRENSNRSSVTRIKRNVYSRQYPVLLVNPDGSTTRIRYKEPRRVITMPVDINSLTEEERLIRLAKRKPKVKVVVQEDDIEDSFKATDYQFLWKKK